MIWLSPLRCMIRLRSAVVAGRHVARPCASRVITKACACSEPFSSTVMLLRLLVGEVSICALTAREAIQPEPISSGRRQAKRILNLNLNSKAIRLGQGYLLGRQYYNLSIRTV